MDALGRAEMQADPSHLQVWLTQGSSPALGWGSLGLGAERLLRGEKSACWSNL